MPIQRTTYHHRPAYRAGPHGHPYSYSANNPASRLRAHRKAQKQLAAIEIHKHAH